MVSQYLQIFRTILISLVLALLLLVLSGSFAILFEDQDFGRVCYLVASKNLEKYGQSNSLDFEECFGVYGEWQGDPYSGYCSLDIRESCARQATETQNGIHAALAVILAILTVFIAYIYIKVPPVRHGFYLAGLLTLMYSLSITSGLLIEVLLVMLLAALIWACYRDELAHEHRKASAGRKK